MKPGHHTMPGAPPGGGLGGVRSRAAEVGQEPCPETPRSPVPRLARSLVGSRDGVLGGTGWG
jgi:hypothetical protein